MRHTVDDGFDFRNLHHSLDINGTEIAETKRTTLQGSIFNKILKPTPEFAELTVRRDEGVVYEKEIGDETELFDRSSD